MTILHIFNLKKYKVYGLRVIDGNLNRKFNLLII